MPGITPNEFVAKWKRVTSHERQVAQEHFIDLCHLVGHPTPNELDPSGTRFAFELGANKTSGGQGWADVAKLGYFGWEYKGKDHDLDKAYDQLLRYRESLQNPPVLVVSDINTIIVRTNYTNLPTRTYTLTLDDLLKPEALKTLKAVFFNPDELKPAITVEGVTEEAARQFSRLAGTLRKHEESPQAVAHFLIRLLFCLFAEDTGLLPERLFPRLLDQTRRSARDFASVLSQLFGVMQGGGYFGAERILHFNGGLFDDNRVLELDGEALDIIAKIDALDWGQMEPSIFGTLFERGLDPAKRSQLGAHYTSKDDILLIVEPVLMAPLRHEWEGVRAEAQKIKAGADGQDTKKRNKASEQISTNLRAFADKLAEMRVLDPACGSGNFLYVALQLLLDLQNEVIAFSDELGAGRFFITVTPAQLFGIEVNEYAHELAQVTIWIGYIQWLVKNGYGLPPEPILKAMDNIKHMDAILAFDADGKAVEPEWPVADVIIGNPPFLGDKRMKTELGSQYVNELRQLYEGRIPGGADMVTYWFEKARQMLADGKAKRAGLLSTNSIRTGSNRRVLDKIKETGDIFMAWDDRSWILDGAAVRVSMVGFDNGADHDRFLNGEKKPYINSDLTSHIDITQVGQLSENAGICFLGMMKAGPFDINSDLAAKMLNQPVNTNGRSNSDVVKRRLGGQDVTDRPRDAWVIDFGLMDAKQSAFYEMPFEYVLKTVKPIRDSNRRKSTQERWWRFGEARPGLRVAIGRLKRCLVTPEVAKWRIFIWMDTTIVPDHKLHVFARDDDYFFGVLQSRIHEVWSLAMCSWMGVGNDPSYSSSRTFETFPMPWHPGSEPTTDRCYQLISDAGRNLNEKRKAWLNPPNAPESALRERTMTNLYNARPSWLSDAHKELDQAVFAAYGWPNDLTDEAILERLLALNLERAK